MDLTWLLLADRSLPSWGVEWAEDRLGSRAGIYIVFEIDRVEQRMRWIRTGRLLMGTDDAEWRSLLKDRVEEEWFSGVTAP